MVVKSAEWSSSIKKVIIMCGISIHYYLKEKLSKAKSNQHLMVSVFFIIHVLLLFYYLFNKLAPVIE